MIELKDLVPGRATHPGEMLAIELDSAQISQQDFARQIGMQKSQLNEIIKGKRSINAESAILIATALGGPPQYWLNAQQNYDLDLARQQYKVQERSKALNTWNRFKGFVGVAYLKAQKYLSGDPMDDVPAIQKLYNIETPEQLENIVHHAPLVLFRKSQHFDENQINIITWVKMVEYFAAHQEVPPFNRYSVSEVVDSLREIILQNDNVLTKVKDTLNRQGIKFVYQPKPDKAPIDGMSCWSGQNPAIGMSLRSSRLDNFAFTLLHELGHVYTHLTYNSQVCFYDNLEDPHTNEQEKEANEFAQSSLLAENEWNLLMASAEQYNQYYILRFSEKIGMHPAIVAGQVCHRTGHYKWKRSEINNIIG